MHPQTLRKYERAGFVVPLRMGALRTYSDEDVARLRLVKHFVDDMGLNLAGVQLALKMTSELLALRRETAAASAPVERIDAMLATLGVRVVRRRQPNRQRSPARHGSRSTRARQWSSVQAWRAIKAVGGLRSP